MQKVIFCFKNKITTLILFLCAYFLFMQAASAQPFRYSRQINWTENQEGLFFSNATFSAEKFGKLPYYIEAFPLFTMNDSIMQVKLENPVFDTLTSLTSDTSYISADPVLKYSTTIFKKKPYLNISLFPFKKNSDGTYLKLLSFTLSIEILPGASQRSLKSAPDYAINSVLANGKWFKLFIDKTGVYKLSASDLASIDPGFSSADPRTIKVYGNGGGMLPEGVITPRNDDLREIPVQVSGEEDGKLDGGDFLLFYGEGPDVWKFKTSDQDFHHQKNLYTDQACYFITYGQGNGKRISPRNSTTITANSFINRFDDYAFYEKDDDNLINSGKVWYDKENFEFTSVRTYHFNFPDIDVTKSAKVTASVAGRSIGGSTTFKVTANGANVYNISIPPVQTSDFAQYANPATQAAEFVPDKNDIDIVLTYYKGGIDGIGYLNYLELHAKRHLTFSGSQMSFRSIEGFGQGKVTEFTMGSSGQQITIWDVTRGDKIRSINASRVGNDYVFRLPTDTLREFIAFDGSGYLSVLSHQSVANQDLHGAGNYDYIILTHPDFLAQANELAEFHRTHDNLTVFVTTPDVIYNEFSSGVQDISAIRDFAKMMYDRAPAGKELKYLLLFGDASYDFKNRVLNNTNYVPSYQSEESLAPTSSYATDDFFALLENNDSLQIGIGRLPVDSQEEAQAAVNKIKHYTSESDSVKNDWRNVITFVSDDQDGNIYMRNADDLTTLINAKAPAFNIDKIFIDAYPQLATPGGARSPDVNSAINLRMQKGTMIMNYIGHGGERGWAHERVLEIPDIKDWSNFDDLPVFVTATCEFTRYDDPEWVSAGEWVFLNPKGGGIALFTTTRPTYADQNYVLSYNFYLHAFNKTNGIYPRMGDIIVSAKNNTNQSLSNRRFVLIGDPALRMNYPNLKAVTTTINGVPVTELHNDTIKALSTMTISGQITDDSGNKITGFNGTVFPTIYDKEAMITTLANDGGTPYNFLLRKNIIYKGKADVVNGDFTFSFIVPKDIAYNFGEGRISYYARSAETDAAGFDSNVIVGGYDNSASVDITGPVIRLFMNDTTFISGGLTDQNPKMLALINDESGINTVGNGIGHDITITLDNNNQDQKIANDYYTSDENTYKTGSILYPFFNLSDGLHTLRLKIWDIYNNSSDASIDFVVAASAELALQHVFNYPNPLRDHTTFSFEFNQPNTEMDVQIDIYNLRGQLIKRLKDKIFTNGYRANTIDWDGTTDGGFKIGSGNYVYNVSVSTPDGKTVIKSSKLVVIR